MSEHPPLLETRKIAKTFGSVVALRSVDLVVQPGEIHALLGANGAGKSTLVKILSGVHRADTGTVSVNGREVDLGSPTAAMQAGLATVFQDPALIPDLTISQNFTLTGVDQDAVRDWLARMDLGHLDFDDMIRDLPLPTLRLLDLARALAHEPDLLMLDEITAALPADQAEHVVSVMHDWKARGKSVLFITHRLGEVLRVCDRATILRDGYNVAAFAPGQGGEGALIDAMLGEVAEKAAAVTSRGIDFSTRPVVLEGRDLQSTHHVKDLSFQLRGGEILGVAALEGQGQDRLFDLLSGDRRPDGGEILVRGKPMVAHSPYDAIRQGVVLVPGDRLNALLPKRSVRENLAAPLYNRISKWFRLAPDEGVKVAGAVDRLSIDTRAANQARRLSGGNQQKLVVGRWLTAGFRTLLCFDPTRGIDIGTKRQIYDLLRELADDGAAILLYTSELKEIPLVCDRVVVMYDGTIVDEQAAATASEESMLTAAHGIQEGAA